MTNEQLIALVEQTSPDELTPAQVGQLRQRLRESPELQAGLRRRVDLETYLAEALGRPNVDGDEMANARRSTPVSRAADFATSTLGVIVLLLVLGVVAGGGGHSVVATISRRANGRRRSVRTGGPSGRRRGRGIPAKR
jgi:hypothetical protein